MNTSRCVRPLKDTNSYIERYVKYFNEQRPCYAIYYDTPVNFRKRFFRGELPKKTPLKTVSCRRNQNSFKNAVIKAFLKPCLLLKMKSDEKYQRCLLLKKLFLPKNDVCPLLKKQINYILFLCPLFLTSTRLFAAYLKSCYRIAYNLLKRLDRRRTLCFFGRSDR